MKRHHFVILLAVLAALILALWPWMTGDQEATVTEPGPVGAVDDYPAGSAIDWQPWGGEARDLAMRKKQGLFVYFHGQWCTWCRQYQDETLEHPDIVAAIRRDFVPVLVNLDRRRDLFMHLGGRGLPFTVLMNARGDPVGRFTGHVSPGDLRDVLREAATRLTTAAAVPEGFDELIGADPEAFLDFLEETYDSATRRLGGASVLGTLSKRPQPMTYRMLLHEPAWADRMPGMLDVLRDDLYDPVDGGFFFFHDPDQPDPDARVETSKVLGLNALFIWLYADAVEVLGRDDDARVLRGALAYLESALWDPERSAFRGSQYSDPDYYGAPPGERAALNPPHVEPVQYADVSGQAIVALVRAGQVLDEPRYLQWAARALEGLDARLGHPDGGYFHFRPDGEPAQLAGYLPAQVWPAAAWWSYHEATGEEHAAHRGAQLLERIAAYRVEEVGGFAERLAADAQPWTESRTHGALAWLLTGPARPSQVPENVLPAQRRARWMRVTLDRLELTGAGDPDDVALGVLAHRRWADESDRSQAAGRRVDQQSESAMVQDGTPDAAAPDPVIIGR